MTSLGLRKDSAAFRKLSKDDIESIENGFTNFRLVNASHFKTRLYEMFWEVDDYLKNGTINGHSFMMRVEYWKTAIKIIRRNLCIGVGTGDVQDEFTKQYIQNKSQLKTESERRRAHSQFLEITVQFGIVGLLFFYFHSFSSSPTQKFTSSISSFYSCFFNQLNCRRHD